MIRPFEIEVIVGQAERKAIKFWRQDGAGSIQNFGDFLTELIADELLLAPLYERTSYRIVGSCIADWLIKDELATNIAGPVQRVAFWGCGMRDETPLDPAVKEHCRFFGVRGPLTRDILGLPSTTVLGDTGLLVPLLHRPSTSPATAGKRICVPHFHDARSRTHILDLTGADEVVRPAVTATLGSLRKMIDDIASASFVLCGALHAAIVAHAFGRPFAFWDSGSVDLPFKWRDFAASIQIPADFTRTVEEGMAFYEERLKPAAKQLALTPILTAAPFLVRPDLLERAIHHDLGSGQTDEARTPHRDLIQRIDMLENLVQGEHVGRTALRTQSETLQAMQSRLVERLQTYEKQDALVNGRIGTALDTLTRGVDELRESATTARRYDAQHHRAAVQVAVELTTERTRSADLTRERDELIRRVQAADEERDRLVEEAKRSEERARAAEIALHDAEAEAAASLAVVTKALDGVRAEVDELREKANAAADAITSRNSAEISARELRTQVQALTFQNQRAAQANADLVDDYARRLFVLHNRSGVLAELRDARLRFRTALPSPGLRSGRADGAPAWRRPDWRSRARLRRILTSTGMFSAAYYRARNPQIGHLDDKAALTHFVDTGMAAGLDPHPLVSQDWLSRQLGHTEQPSLQIFLTSRPDLDPHPLFSTSFYLSVHPDVTAFQGSAFGHYVAHGAAERRQPHPAFDPAWYAGRRGASASRAPDLLLDYLLDPDAFVLDPHPLFDARRYLRELAATEPGNPLLHYLVQGEAEGRAPHPLFEPSYYLQRNGDVASAGLSPFLHFLRNGAAEYRVTHPLFDPSYYARTNPDVPGAAENPLLHYVTSGAAEGRLPSAHFPRRAVAEAFPTIGESGLDPLVAFMDGIGLSIDVPPRSLRAALPPPIPARENAPTHDGTYRLPDRMRDHVEVRYGAEAVTRLSSLMTIVDAYGDRPNAFAMSQGYDALASRLKAATGTADEVVDVSIVVPVHNALVYTMTCVTAVLETPGRRSYEILIGDDASTDDTPGLFGMLGGRVRLIRHEANLGFLENCNVVAREGRGRHVLLLNNDTLPLPGWLDALVDLAERDPSIGFVGSKLLNADGTLQEAGGILWNDGSAWNYGRNADPQAPAYNYVRDVDYCSGASILVPRKVWDELGGFDPAFKPAYCEDSDLAFRTRAAGYRTVYQPFSEVVHHEGRSHGRDEAQGVKAYQAANTNKLLDRWRDTLQRENFANGQHVFLARDRSRDRPHLLVVDHYVPQWDRDAGSRTMYHFLKAFVECGVHVIFWSDNLFQDPIYTRPLQELGIEVIYGPSFVGQFERWLSENEASVPYILLSRPHIAIKYIDAIKRQSTATILYYGHDLHWRRLLDEYEVNGSQETLRLSHAFRDQETRLWAMSAVVMYPSERERDLVVQEVGPGRTVLAVPAWTFDREEIAAARAADPAGRDPHHVLFVGGFTHGPNVDGILWFVQNVLPRLRTHDTRFKVTIVGSNAPQSVTELAGTDVTVAGFVSDDALAKLYREAGIAIAPLRFGGGVKGKVIEAFARGVPVVTTPVGVQGIAGSAGIAAVAETPGDFAAAIIRIAEDPEAGYAQARAALDFVGREYVIERLIDLLTPSMPELSQSPGSAGPIAIGPPAEGA